MSISTDLCEIPGTYRAKGSYKNNTTPDESSVIEKPTFSQSTREVRSILVFLGPFEKIIPGFAILSVGLTKLPKRREIDITNEDIENFEKLKNIFLKQWNLTLKS